MEETSESGGVARIDQEPENHPQGNQQVKMWKKAVLEHGGELLKIQTWT